MNMNIYQKAAKINNNNNKKLADHMDTCIVK